jgi:hypothetical protein
MAVWGVIAAVGLSVFQLTAGAAGADAPSGPKIVANPNSVMVNTYTTLTGTRFPAHRHITIQECGRTSWVVTMDPCLSSNEVHVLTNGGGRFTAKMKAEVCPDGVTKQPAFQEVCYAGEIKPTGVDTVELVGAGEFTVTGP